MAAGPLAGLPGAALGPSTQHGPPAWRLPTAPPAAPPLLAAQHALVMLGVTRISDARTPVHTGLWPLKAPLWAGLCWAFLYVGDGALLGWGQAARVFSVFFIVVQVGTWVPVVAALCVCVRVLEGTEIASGAARGDASCGGCRALARPTQAPAGARAVAKARRSLRRQAALASAGSPVPVPPSLFGPASSSSFWTLCTG